MKVHLRKIVENNDFEKFIEIVIYCKKCLYSYRNFLKVNLDYCRALSKILDTIRCNILCPIQIRNFCHFVKLLISKKSSFLICEVINFNFRN